MADNLRSLPHHTGALVQHGVSENETMIFRWLGECVTRSVFQIPIAGRPPKPPSVHPGPQPKDLASAR